MVVGLLTRGISRRLFYSSYRGHLANPAPKFWCTRLNYYSTIHEDQELTAQTTNKENKPELTEQANKSETENKLQPAELNNTKERDNTTNDSTEQNTSNIEQTDNPQQSNTEIHTTPQKTDNSETAEESESENPPKKTLEPEPANQEPGTEFGSEPAVTDRELPARNPRDPVSFQEILSLSAAPRHHVVQSSAPRSRIPTNATSYDTLSEFSGFNIELWKQLKSQSEAAKANLSEPKEPSEPSEPAELSEPSEPSEPATIKRHGREPVRAPLKDLAKEPTKSLKPTREPTNELKEPEKEPQEPIKPTKELEPTKRPTKEPTKEPTEKPTKGLEESTKQPKEPMKKPTTELKELAPEPAKKPNAATDQQKSLLESKHKSINESLEKSIGRKVQRIEQTLEFQFRDSKATYKKLSQQLVYLADKISLVQESVSGIPSEAKGKTGLNAEKEREDANFEFVIRGICYIMETQDLPEIGHKARQLVDILGVPFNPPVWKALLAASVVSQNEYMLRQMRGPDAYSDKDTEFILSKYGTTDKQFWINYVKSLSK